MSTETDLESEWLPSAPKARTCVELFKTLCEYPPDSKAEIQDRVADQQAKFSEWVSRSGALVETSTPGSLDHRWKTESKMHRQIIERLVCLKEDIEKCNEGLTLAHTQSRLTCIGLHEDCPTKAKRVDPESSGESSSESDDDADDFDPWHWSHVLPNIDMNLRGLNTILDYIPTWRCICKRRMGDYRNLLFDRDDFDGQWIRCDSCKVGQHVGCAGYGCDKAEEYFCEECRPDLHSFLIGADG